MDNHGYEKVVDWAKRRGLKLHRDVERKCVDGIWGMYATRDIPKHTVLLRYPLSGTLPVKQDFSYPPTLNNILKYAHTATLEYAKGEKSDWSGLFGSTEPLEDLKRTSAYFLTPEELSAIQQMNPMLHRIILERNGIIKNQIDALGQLDPNIRKDDATVIALNLKTRSWGEGFLPVFDLYNHSCAYGAQVFRNEKHLFFMTKMDYKAGDEIWISYGRRDIYDYAIDYDFFDPNGVHSIFFANRGAQVARNDFEKAVVKHAASRHKIQTQMTPQGLFYQLAEGDAMFLEHAPSARMIEYINNTAFRSREELKAGRCSKPSFDLRLNEILDAMLSANQVDKFNPDDLSPRLARFYHLLRKEKQMLLNNKQWAKFNSVFSNDIDPAVKQKVS